MINVLCRHFSPNLVGVRPTSVLIDGGNFHVNVHHCQRQPNKYSTAVVQTTSQSFDFNGESDLDLEYAMGLTAPQTITLLQTGDIVEGYLILCRRYVLQANCYAGSGAGFGNWLDAVDGSFCTFEGGDDPTQVKLFASTCHLPSYLSFRMESTQTLHLVVLTVIMASYYICVLAFISEPGPESCGIIAPPFVVSVSYVQDEASVTAKYANRQCTEYAKVGSYFSFSLSYFSLT